MMTKPISLLLALLLAGCSSTYSTKWACPRAQGIGCSSLEYADEIARQQIQLNTAPMVKGKVLVHHDLLGSETWQEMEIGQ